MQAEKPSILIVAGYDQSAGAGILADVKTAEAHGAYAWAACTGFTFQNEKVITAVQWFSEAEIFKQIDLCFDSVCFDWVKIGIARSAEMIQHIIQHLLQHNPSIGIVLDPVIRASSGASFWEGINSDAFEQVMQQVYLVTPNWNEMEYLYPAQDVLECCNRLSLSGNVYLKGGHNPHHPGTDYLWHDGTLQIMEPAVEKVFQKHGSGCVLSSSIAANLAKGHDLPESAMRSKRYIEQFLNSNTTLLGWHQYL